MDLNDLLSCMAASLRERLAGQGIDLVLSLDALGTLRVGERITPVSLAELLRKSVFQRLLDNALEAMPHGGRLMIETRNVEMTQADADAHPDVMPGPYLSASVGDTGAGFGEAVGRRLFEPFFTTKEGRLGIGLATAYGTVRNCGGTIHAASEPGAGATFTVLLPNGGS